MLGSLQILQIYHFSDLPYNSQPLFLFPLPPSCVLGRSACEQGCWGNYKGTLSVPGKKLYSYLSTWMVLDEPALMSLGSVELCKFCTQYIYCNGKGVYFFMFWKNHETEFVCVSGRGSVMQKKNLTQRNTTGNFSSALDLHKLDGLILLVSSLLHKERTVKLWCVLTVSPSTEKSLYGAAWNPLFCGIAIMVISNREKSKYSGSLGFLFFI